MPNPSNYKKNEKDKFMADCMHQNMHEEKKPHDQAVAVCLSMWRNRNKKKKKKCSSEILARISKRLYELCL